MAYKIQKEIDANITTRIIGHTEATPINTAYPIESLVENLPEFRLLWIIQLLM